MNAVDGRLMVEWLGVVRGEPCKTIYLEMEYHVLCRAPVLSGWDKRLADRC